MLIPIFLAAVCAFAVVAGMASQSPLRMALLHNSAWAIALCIYATDVMRLAVLSGYAWTLIGLSIGIFNCAVILSSHGRASRESAESPTGDRAVLIGIRAYLFVCAMFFVGLAIYLRMIAANFGIEALLRDPTSIRASEAIAYMEEFPLIGKLLFYLGPLCMVLGLYPRFVKGLQGRLWRVPLVIIIAVAQLATLQRTNIFVAILWILGLMVLNLDGAQKKRGRQALAMVAALATAIVAFQVLASALGKTGASNYRVSIAVAPQVRDSPWLSLMMYATSGIPAFGQLVESDNESWPPPASVTYGDYNPQTYGAATLSGPLRLVPGVPQWNEVAPFTMIPYPTNVYTWLEPWYRDFRGFGVVFGSAFMGLLSGSLGRVWNRRPEYLLLGSLLLGLSGMATFVNRYGMVMTCVLFAAIWMLGWSSRRRQAPRPRRAKPPLHSHV